MAKHFLLEIGLEEMPARFIQKANQHLSDKLGQWLHDQHIKAGPHQLFATPRRLSVLIEDVAEKQEDQWEEAKGPALAIAKDEQGNWSKAASGFARTHEVSVEELSVQTIKGKEYVCVQKHRQGQQSEVLLQQVQDVIGSLSFPKNMRWGDHDYSFIRPIRWIVALFGDTIIPMQITNVTSSHYSFGHRFLGGKVNISSAQRYEQYLEEQYVIAHAQKRQDLIVKQLHELEQQKQVKIKIDAGLLHEVNHLVEYPTAVFGSFDESFLTLPEEVLITSMREHQRYFPVYDENDQLLPHFVTIRNGKEDVKGLVSKGNEKVLRARLADAQFFYEEDQKVEIDAVTSQLENVIFHEELGTVGDKVRRIREVSQILANKLDLKENQYKKVDRAAEICKFDLVTLMVNEFPKLQGTMGQVYAHKLGEDVQVAQAIYEHYLPRSATDDIPASDIGSIISLADKLDTVTSCFSIGLIPTGSQDPYALRRQAGSILRILFENKWRINLWTLLDEALQVLHNRQLLQRSQHDVKQELIHFFDLRLKKMLEEAHTRYDVIDATLPSSGGDILSLFEKSAILMNQLEQNEQFKTVVEAFTRMNNLAQKFNQMNPASIDPSLFEHDQEHLLYDTYEHIEKQFMQAEQDLNWSYAYECLLKLVEPISAYFDHVMVMTLVDRQRNNRLALLYKITSLIHRFADLSKIVFASSTGATKGASK